LYELQQTAAPDFWWDLTLDHNAPISTVLILPPTLEGRTEPNLGFIFEWNLEWAEGVTRTWSAGGSAYWVAWTWESKTDSGKLRSVFLLGKGKVITVLNLAHTMKPCGELEVYMNALLTSAVYRVFFFPA
jgi:hypothetical protein